MKQTKEIILQKIKEMIGEKETQDPKIVMSPELFASLSINANEYEQVIKSLLTEQKITYGILFNSVYFRLKN